jgi:hypothetical protein
VPLYHEGKAVSPPRNQEVYEQNRLSITLATGTINYFTSFAMSSSLPPRLIPMAPIKVPVVNCSVVTFGTVIVDIDRITNASRWRGKHPGSKVFSDSIDPLDLSILLILPHTSVVDIPVSSNHLFPRAQSTQTCLGFHPEHNLRTFSTSTPSTTSPYKPVYIF